MHRFDGGPLQHVNGYMDAAPLEVGERGTFLHAKLVNGSSQEVRIERIAPERTLEGSRVEIWVPQPGVRRGSDQRPFPRGVVNGGSFPSRGATLADLRPAAGARVAGSRGSAIQFLPLLITVTPARRGCAGFGGLVIDYRNGLRRYRRVMKLAFGGHAGQRTRCEDVMARLADRSG